MASTLQDVQEKLLALSFDRGYITIREATDACLDAGLDITDVERVTGYLIDSGVIFNDDAKLSLPNMRNASSGNDESGESDDDEIYDRAQADYGALYTAIKKEYPQMSHLVDVIASTLPPQENEWKHLVWQAQSGNRWARDRIVAMYLRVVLRMSRDFARDFNCDAEDAFQHGSMGLMNAIRAYDKTNPGPFPAAIGLFILANMQRGWELRDAPFKLKTNLNQHILEVMSRVRALQKVGIDRDDAIDWSASDLPNKMTNHIKAYLTCETVPPGVLCDVPSTIETERGAMLDDVRHHLMAAMVGECPPEGRVYRTIAPLNAQRRLVLRLRFGLDGEKPLTLEQAGRRLGVTRERIRQIEERALEVLQANDDLRGLWEDVIEAKEAGNSTIRELPDKIKAMKQVLSMPQTTYLEMSAKIEGAGLKASPPTVAKWLRNRESTERLVAYYEQGAVLKPMGKDERDAGIKADLAAGFKANDVAWRYDVSVSTVSGLSKAGHLHSRFAK